MKNISIWKDIKKIDFPILNDDLNVDILIIGGGITGISTLYHLKDSKEKIALVDQDRIGMSTTANSTGKLCYLQNDLIDKIRKFYNDDVASCYLKSQIETIEDMVDIIEKNKISCDLEKVPSYLYTNNNKEIPKIKSLESFLLKNKIQVEHDNSELVKSKYMIKVQNTYIINPLKLVYGLIKNNKFSIYEKTGIKKIEKKENKYICYTDNNKIETKKIIIASHYPYFILPFLFPIKVSLEKSYLSASKKNLKPISLISYSYPFISIRTYNNYLIYLSNSHSLDKHVCDKKNYNELIKKLDDIKLSPSYLWSNIDIMTSDGLPYIGKLKGDIYIGTGYNTWGLTNGFLAGKVLSDLVCNRKNKYERLFNPNRSNFKHIPSYINNIVKNIRGFIAGYTSKYKSKYICPHLGCKLIYNEQEKTYDCPCHGSRFDEYGKCISAPSKKDIF